MIPITLTSLSQIASGMILRSPPELGSKERGVDLEFLRPVDPMIDKDVDGNPVRNTSGTKWVARDTRWPSGKVTYLCFDTMDEEGIKLCNFYNP